MKRQSSAKPNRGWSVTVSFLRSTKKWAVTLKTPSGNRWTRKEYDNLKKAENTAASLRLALGKALPEVIGELGSSTWILVQLGRAEERRLIAREIRRITKYYKWAGHPEAKQDVMDSLKAIADSIDKQDDFSLPKSFSVPDEENWS